MENEVDDLLGRQRRQSGQISQKVEILRLEVQHDLGNAFIVRAIP